MQVSLEKSRGLERRLKIEVPNKEVADREQKKLVQLSKTAKIDGFRKGKIPLTVIKSRYGQHVVHDVIGDVIQDSLVKALMQEKLNPAGRPRIEDTHYEEGTPLTYVAIIEVYPEITLKPFEKLKVAKPVAQITDADIDDTVQKIREQQKTWQPAQEGVKVTKGMRVDIDFTGTIKGEAFEGGSAQHFQLELGSGRMIPGFEDEIIGMKVGEERTIDVKFPKDYQKEDLAGKKAQFLIKMHQAEIAQLPELNEEFFTKLGIKEGGALAELKVELRKNMQRELVRAQKKQLKKNVLQALYEQNKFDVPQALINDEVDHEKQRIVKMLGGQSNEEFLQHWMAEFKPEAERRVAYGLLMSEVIKANDIKVDAERVRDEIASIAEAYENPQEVTDYYLQNRQHRMEIEAIALEDQVIDKVLADAKTSEEKMSFDELMKLDKQR